VIEQMGLRPQEHAKVDWVYANIRGRNAQSRWYDGNVRGSRTSIWGKYQRGGCNSEPDFRMFYNADSVSSGRSSFLSRDATELVPMMMMMMILLIYVQGKPKYSRPPEGYRDVLS
jgi:hypothetical protein